MVSGQLSVVSVGYLGLALGSVVVLLFIRLNRQPACRSFSGGMASHHTTFAQNDDKWQGATNFQFLMTNLQ